MERSKTEMYDVLSYTDEELFDLLDLVNPSDRVLEAKIIQMIKKYSTIHNKDGEKFVKFFKDIYEHFFDVSTSNDPPTSKQSTNATNEGFTSQNLPPPPPPQTQQLQHPPINNPPTPLQITNGVTSPPTVTSSVGYVKDYINPLLKQTIKRIISIDSQYRGASYPMSTDFTFNLSEPLKDVVELSLSSIQLPYTWYTVTNSYGANYLFLKATADGLNNGQHDYKIEIPSGNYSPDALTTAINKSIETVKNANTDVYFGETSFIYNSSSNSTTAKIEIANNFTESDYYLEFEVDPLECWDASDASMNRNRIDNSNNIGGYLGFMNKTYQLNTVNFLQNLLPAPTKSASYGIIGNNNVFENVQLTPPIPKYIYDGDYSNEMNGISYYVNKKNNYFTLVLYQGPKEYLDVSDASLVSVKIILSNLKIQNSYSRQTILNEVNYQLSINPFFTGETEMMRRIYINDPSMINFGKSFFSLHVNWKKNLMPLNKTNLKTIVIFPDDSTNNQSTSLWVKYDNKSSCFNFENAMNELNNIYAELPLIQSVFDVSQCSIKLTCKETGYDKGNNDYVIDVSNTRGIGIKYTLNEFINSVNASVQTININTSYNDVGVMKNTVLTINDNAHFYFDINKIFNATHYFLKGNDDRCYFGGTVEIYSSNILSAENSLGLKNGNVNLSGNTTFYFNIYSASSTSYKIENDYLMKIYPIPGYDNSYAGNWTIPTSTALKNGVQKLDTFVGELEQSLKSFYDTETSFPLQNSKVIAETNSLIKMNIVISKTLTQNSYDVSFTQEPIVKEWDKILKMDVSTKSHYVLKDYYVNGLSYVDISGNGTITDNSLKLTNNNKNITVKFVPITEELVTEKNSYQMSISVPAKPSSYSSQELIDYLNAKFADNPITAGTVISTFTTSSGAVYAKMRTNINKTFTANDYSLVFYDLYNFVKCYLGTTSVRNVTWDTTLGWILGFHNQTEYILSELSGTPVKTITGDTNVTTSLYNYFLIKLDDYTQSHMNDGVVTLASTDTAIALPSYASKNASGTYQCDPSKSIISSAEIPKTEGQNQLTQNQIYSAQQIINSRVNQSTTHRFSRGLFTQDIFGLIPIKTSGLQNGAVYVEFGGTLQNQQRTYFGPVNISRLSIQLLNDRGDLVDLNGANWSFSFICEQLYQQKSI